MKSETHSWIHLDIFWLATKCRTKAASPTTQTSHLHLPIYRSHLQIMHHQPQRTPSLSILVIQHKTFTQSRDYHGQCHIERTLTLAEPIRLLPEIAKNSTNCFMFPHVRETNGTLARCTVSVPDSELRDVIYLIGKKYICFYRLVGCYPHLMFVLRRPYFILASQPQDQNQGLSLFLPVARRF